MVEDTRSLTSDYYCCYFCCIWGPWGCLGGLRPGWRYHSDTCLGLGHDSRSDFPIATVDQHRNDVVGRVGHR